MPRINRPKAHRVILSNHAWDRFQERGGRKKRTKLVNLITAKLNESLGPGLVVDRTGAAWVEVKPWLWASLRLTDIGWIVTTIIDYRVKVG